MSKQALLVIDMLNDFVLQGAPLEVPDARGIISPLEGRIKNARTNDIPVIYICDSHEKNDREFIRMGWPPHALAGSRGAQVVDQLELSIHDAIIYKKTYSGFFETDLDRVLKEGRISELLITGCVTNICVLYTVAGLRVRGFEVIVPKNCVASFDKDSHEWALRHFVDVLGAKVE